MHLAFIALSVGGVVPCATASDYVQRKAAATQSCQAINPSDYQSGLAFNPDGYKSYYEQSHCYQDAAVQFRDASLCSQVRRRWSLFWSSWGVSPGHCRSLVSEAMTADRTEIETERKRYLSGPPRFQSFRIVPNGNGRDFDILPEFSAGYAHGYALIFEIIGAHPSPILVHSNGYYIDSNAQLRIFVRQSEIRARFPEFELNHPYSVRATLTLSIGNGGLSGFWSDEFLESIFPVRERSQSITIQSVFRSF